MTSGLFAMALSVSPEAKSKVKLILQSEPQIFKLSSFTLGIPAEAHTCLETKNYPAVVEHFAQRKLFWANQENTATLSDSLSYILADSLAPYWLGTPWDFNGVSKQPQEGSIACGYFVYGLLQDAGFKLPRAKLSQATSENSIKAIVNESAIKRFSKASIVDFIQAMKEWGDGIYLVGLDYHIGLIQVKGGKVQMIHSSVYPPTKVVIEEAKISLALINSNYRIVGKITNPETLKKWLNDNYFSL